MRYLLSLILIVFISSYVFAGDSLETWEYHFPPEQIGSGLNMSFALTIGTHKSYAARLYLAPFFEWEAQHDSTAWPEITKGKYLRPISARYIDQVEFYADNLLSRINLHPRVLYYSFDLPYIPNKLKAKLETNEGKIAVSSVEFPENLKPIRPGYPAPHTVDFRQQPVDITDERRFFFHARLAPFASGNYFGATLIYRCQPTESQGEITALRIKVKQHELYAPTADTVLVETTLAQPVYRMSLISQVNLDRKLKNPKETDKVTFVATCSTKSGYQYTRQREVTIKSLYSGNPGSGYYNPYDHVNIH